jgi:hypothetical protein
VALTAKFQADFASFYSAVEKAEVSLKSFETGAGNVEKSLTRMGNSFSGVKIVQEAHLMTKAMLDAGGMASLTEKELKKLAATVGEASDKMKRMGLEVPPDFQKITDAANAIKPATDGAVVSFGKLVSSFISAQAVIGLVKTGFDALVGLLKESVTAYGEQEAATNKLNTALRNSGQFTPELSKKYDDLATSLQQTTVYSDDLTTEMEALLVQVGNVMPEQMKGALKASMDLASGLGIDLRTATLLVGKAFEGETGTLKRYGIVIDEATLKTQGASAVLDAIQAKFGGQAQAEANTYAGQIKQVANAWNDVEESIGKAILDLPLVQHALRELRDEAEHTSHSVSSLSTWWETFLNLAQGADFTKTIQHVRELNAALSEEEAFLRAIDRANANAPDLSGHSNLIGAPPTTGALGMEVFARQVEEDNKRKEEAKRVAAELARANREWADAVASLDGRVIALNVDLLLLQGGLRKFGTGMAAVAPGLVDSITGHGLDDLIKQGRLTAQQTIPDVAGAARENIAAATSSSGGRSGLFSGLTSAIPNAIVGAIQGGGNPAAAAAAVTGNQIGANLVKNFGSTITKTLGGVFGGAINAVLPGLGTLAAPLVNFIGKLFGKSEESSKVSPLRNEFFKLQGGLETLNPKVLALAGNLKLVEAVFKAKTVDEYNRAIKDLTDLLGTQDQAMGDLQQTAEKYGFTLAELGPTLQRQNLDKQAQELYKDFQVLNAGGLDHTAILTRMSGAVNDYVHNALQMGIAVPESMRKMLDEMAKQGTLTDLAGNKIDDLEQSGLSFTMTMSEGFKSLIEEVKKLTNAIAVGLGLALDNLPEPTITVHTKFDTSGIAGAPDYQGPRTIPGNPYGSYPGDVVEAKRGGRITEFGLAYFDRGSMGRILPWRPRGTDTVPAMLTPGETVRTKTQESDLQRQLASAVVGRQAVVVNINIEQIVTKDDPQSVAENFKLALRDDIGGVNTAVQTVARQAVS